MRLILAFLRQVSMCPHWSPNTDSRGSWRTLPSGPHEEPTTVPSNHQSIWKCPFFSLYSCRVWSCLAMPYNFPKLHSHLEAPPRSKLKSFSSSRSSRVDLCLGLALRLRVLSRQTAARSNHAATTPVCTGGFLDGTLLKGQSDEQPALLRK